MEEYSDRACARLKENLRYIRQAGGWTAEEFGNMIGVTKQTIGNLENSNTKRLTKTQYIAIRAVLDYEIKMREGQQNDILSKTVHLLLDKEDLSSEEIDKIRRATVYANEAQKNGYDASSISKDIIRLLGATLLAISIKENWLEKLFKSKE